MTTPSSASSRISGVGTPTSYPLVEVADVLEETGFLVYTEDGKRRDGR